MFESGKSSFYQYESGSPELISIFEILQEYPGVYGVRVKHITEGGRI